MTFWILLGLLCLLATLAIVWPLVRPLPAAGLDAAASRLAVTRDRRLEIDREEQAGRLSAAEAAEARQELIESLAREMPAADPVAPASTGSKGASRLWTALALAVIVPAAALIAYQQIGVPQIGANPSLVEANTPVTEQDLRTMAAQLVEHTRANPEDAQGWMALAQAHRALGEYAGAAEAFGRVAVLQPDNARVLADEAEMIAITQDRLFAGRPAELLRQALAIDANDLKANALMGAVYMQAGQREQAVPHLRIVLASMDPASAEAEQISQIVQSIEADGPGAAANAATPAPAAPGATGATATAAISGRITLAGPPPAAGSILFISARAPTGPRIPYAALRITEPSLPMQFELSDANAMSPQRLLSSADEVIIEARLSQSGNAIRQPGDRFGASAPVATNSQDVQITIDQTVP